ncbi:MAG: hypothetical protein DMG07_08850 [Acidobacteria bacterium]|nr:MAG: hypothetical protein DMG07_08850 [Acidobacteriota bacterium]
MAGAVPARSGDYRTLLDGISINISGGRSESNNFILDGISNNNEYQLNVVVQPSIEAVQEFKIQVAQFAAEFGRASGGVVNMAIKSGSNQLHGSLFEFYQSDALNARSFFDAQKPPFLKNQFGFSAGGPLLRNRTFFFGAYEGSRSELERTRRNIVPDPAWIKGDFSSAPFRVYDPLTARADPADPGRTVRDPFPNNNVIPASRIDPVGRVMAEAYPAPNNVAAGDPNNWVGLVPERRRQNQYIGRLDHQVASKDALFGRAVVDSSDLGLAGPFLGLGSTVFKKGVNILLAETHGFSSRLINEVRGGYNYINFPVVPDVQEDVVAKAGDIPGRAPAPGLPRGGPRNFTSLATAGLPGYSPPVFVRTHVYQALDNLTYIRASHTLKAGIDVQRHQNFRWNNQTGGAALSFDGRYTGGPSVPTGVPTFAPNGLADMLLGLPATVGYRIPFTINLGKDIRNTGLGSNRPDRIRDGNVPNSERTLDRYFDTGAFVEPAQFRFGNAGQNILTGPGFKSFELSLLKNVPIAERARLQFRTEFFNAFNWVNFNPPTAALTSPNYGRITGADTGRNIQFGVKVIW